jgi:hypothetical protein
MHQSFVGTQGDVSTDVKVSGRKYVSVTLAMAIGLLKLENIDHGITIRSMYFYKYVSN